MDMNNIKMTELILVGTWLHHWFPRIYHLNKYYVVHSYPYIILYFLFTNVLFRQFHLRAGVDLP